MSVFGISNIGQKLDNEDSYWAADLTYTLLRGTANGFILCVCDGMGGLDDGALASTTVIEAIRAQVLSGDLRPESIVKTLKSTSLNLFKEASSKHLRCGTTCTLLIVVGKEYRLFHVGDSRCYQISRDNVYKKLTKDQTAFELFRNDGRLAPKQGHSSIVMLDGKEVDTSTPEGNRQVRKLRSQLTHSLGSKESVEISQAQGTVSVGDIFLISSDGFWHGLETDVKWPLKLRHAGDAGTEAYLSYCADDFIARGEKDNLTAVVARMGN